MSLLWLMVAAVCVGPAASYKILMFPYNNKSHLIEFHGVGRQLLQRGHQVHIFLSRADPAPKEIYNYGYKFVHPTTNDSTVSLVIIEEDSIRDSNKNFIQAMIDSKQAFENLTTRTWKIADSLLNDKALFDRIKSENYDFALVDTVLFQTYFMMIPYKLGIPYGGLTALLESFQYRMPNFPSAFPDVMFTPTFGADAGQLGSSFIHRFQNLFAVVFHELWAIGWTDEQLKAHNVTEYELRKHVAPHFIDQHPILTDPMVTVPGVHMVGGLATRPARPIVDPTILSFIQASDTPLIVCSFGTIMEYLTLELKTKLFNAFRRVPYRVVMRLKGDLTAKPDNVLAVDWLPQNDLLAHNKTALFITHSGNNGQNEALYHAVPMVAFYIFGDQLYNAGRVARRGYGVQLNLLAFTEDDLVNAINQVLGDKSYADRVRVASEIFRLQNPAEVVADAIEHAIKYGTEHLRNDEAFDMSIVEYLMLDIVFIVYAVITILFYLSVLLLRKVLRVLRSKLSTKSIVKGSTKNVF